MLVVIDFDFDAAFCDGIPADGDCISGGYSWAFPQHNWKKEEGHASDGVAQNYSTHDTYRNPITWGL